MKIGKVKVEEVTVKSSEAGMYEFKDTGRSVEKGDTAYVVISENVISGAKEKVFFKDKKNAENFQ